MYYKDTGFRALYHRFAIFRVGNSSKFDKVMEDFPKLDNADSILTYAKVKGQNPRFQGPAFFLFSFRQ